LFLHFLLLPCQRCLLFRQFLFALLYLFLRRGQASLDLLRVLQIVAFELD